MILANQKFIHTTARRGLFFHTFVSAAGNSDRGLLSSSKHPLSFTNFALPGPSPLSGQVVGSEVYFLCHAMISTAGGNASFVF